MRFEDAHRQRNSLDLDREKRHAKDFEDQWQHPGHITIGNESFGTYDIRPHDPKSATPVLIIPGWNLGPDTWKDNMRALVDSGRRTIAVEAPHGAGADPSADDPSIPESEMRKITAFIELIDAQQIEKTDAIAHSEGCIDVLLAAAQSPERFRNVILVNPSGMMRDDSTLRLSMRFAVEMVRGIGDSVRGGTFGKSLEIGGAIAKSAIAEPVRSFKETQSIARTGVYELLRALKERGIGVVIIHSPSDRVFPMEKMVGEPERTRNGDFLFNDKGKLQMKTVGTIGAQRNSDEPDFSKIVDGFYSVAGGHSAFLENSETYTRLAESALTALEAKQGSR